ncbi:AzlD domain-containing protein [Vibrio marisflavi]|uniref:Branched-chain amino acid transport n=1 Tax=Vibrio marisflavi CECT 7928 TaxID=634439 RepID=A0ABM9A304_9VIBR|nr:AzlD domain-containing protein [Vibrio marisflavi]CAH0539069.1 hypothetical protein VMF7928_01868 [Vibrio marisflavi CECT 7928]
MNSELWLAVLISAVGTYCLRLLPTLWMQKRIANKSGKKTVESVPTWISILGPLMIAAMLGASLVPSRLSSDAWLATGLGVVITLAVWYRTKSLGWPVLAGVLAYGAIEFLFSVYAQ